MIRVESPFPAYAIPRMWDWMQAFGAWRVTDDYGPQDRESFIDHWDKALRDVQSWGVYSDSELGGIITVQEAGPTLATAHMLFKKSFYGRDTTLVAAREVFGQVFAAGVTRIESYVFEDNASMIGLGRSLGAVKEGVLRNRTVRKGRPISLVILGLLKEDFERKETETLCPLSPSAPPSLEDPLSLEVSPIAAAPPAAPAAASAS